MNGMEQGRPSIDQLATLGNLRLSAPEWATLEKELAAILGFVEKLRSARVEEVPATNQVTELENVYRGDQVERFPHYRTLIESASHHDGSLFIVPAVFGDEE